MYDEGLAAGVSMPHRFSVTAVVDSQLDGWMDDYFDGMMLQRCADSTWLKGELPDLAAVYGLVLTLRDTGVGLLTLEVKRTEGCGKR